MLNGTGSLDKIEVQPSVKTQRMVSPLPLPIESWLHLRSYLRVYTLRPKIHKLLWRPERSYLIPLNGNVLFTRVCNGDAAFGVRVLQGSVWPLDAQRENHVVPYTDECVEIGWLLESTVKKVLHFSAELRRFFVHQLISTQSSMRDQLVIHVTGGSVERVAHMLLLLDMDCAPSPIICTHFDLALLTNLQRETVSLAISLLRKLGYIRTQYRHITICNRERLRQYAEQSYGLCVTR